jgi:hypothetical protein
MRTLTAAETAAITSAGQGSRLRVRVSRDGGTTFDDLSALAIAGSFDFLDSASRSQVGQDQPFANLTFSVRRQVEQFSLAELHGTSKVNAASVLLQKGRLVVVDACLIPPDTDPVSGDWKEIFRGDILDVDSGELTRSASPRRTWGSGCSASCSRSSGSTAARRAEPPSRP